MHIWHQLSLLALIALSLATVVASFGGLWWGLDLLSHFRPQYAWALLALCGVSLLVRENRIAVACLVFLLGNLLYIGPLYWGTQPAFDPQKSTVSIVAFNVLYNNENTAEVVNYLAKQDADLVLVLEATEAIEEAATRALPHYAKVGHSREDAFGMLLFSRVPIVDETLLYLDDAELLAISVQLQLEGESISVLGIHTMPPSGGAQSAMRDRMLERARDWALKAHNPIIVGDLNATPFSSAFRRLVKGPLKNSQIGFGLQCSWPSFFWPLCVSIDHAVIGENLTTISRSVGPFLGSDHRPLLLRFGFAK